MQRLSSPIARDPTAAVEVHHVDDRFVPARVSDLLALLTEECTAAGHASESCGELLRLLEAIILQEASEFERALSDEYSFFNPDRDTIPLHSDAEARTPAGYSRIHRRLEYLLDKANFEQLNEVQIDQALNVARTHGMRVQLDATRVDELALWVRGRGFVQRDRRSWRHPIRGETITLSVFRRLVVLARLKDDPHLLVKIFKDIPEEDVEALLPHARVAMGWTDRLFMLSGSATALGTTIMKFLSLATLAISRVLWVVIVGAATLTWRTFSGYRRARLSRDSQRTRHLYFQNVANNHGAIHLLMRLITEEEIKEIATVFMLSSCAAPGARDESTLRAQISEYLQRRLGVRVNFDISDAMETMDRLGLWQDRSTCRPLPIEEAIRRLRDHWHGRLSLHYHRESCDRRAELPRVAGAPASARS